jgi:hypothetical protein
MRKEYQGPIARIEFAWRLTVVIAECRVDLRKPKGGKVIGETGLAGEDGA